ncbi:hypothetical protein [Paraburkholderia sediminicola]|uniref:hypothetical protein n=1 Tax=Paraburkholderia sediminicola TaxID=458836 RepID=UPI0038BCBB07
MMKKTSLALNKLSNLQPCSFAVDGESPPSIGGSKVKIVGLRQFPATHRVFSSEDSVHRTASGPNSAETPRAGFFRWISAPSAPASVRGGSPSDALEGRQLSAPQLNHPQSVASNTVTVDNAAKLAMLVSKYGGNGGTLADIKAKLEVANLIPNATPDQYCIVGRILFEVRLNEILTIAGEFRDLGQVPDAIDRQLADCVGILIEKIHIHRRGEGVYQRYFEGNVLGVLRAADKLSRGRKCDLMLALMKKDLFKLAEDRSDCEMLIGRIIQSIKLPEKLDDADAMLVLRGLLKCIEVSRSGALVKDDRLTEEQNIDFRTAKQSLRNQLSFQAKLRFVSDNLESEAPGDLFELADDENECQHLVGHLVEKITEPAKAVNSTNDVDGIEVVPRLSKLWKRIEESPRLEKLAESPRFVSFVDMENGVEPTLTAQLSRKVEDAIIKLAPPPEGAVLTPS